MKISGSFLSRVALVLAVLAVGVTAATADSTKGGSLVLNPASYDTLAPQLSPHTSLQFQFNTAGAVAPKMIVDGGPPINGVHDALTDWNVWCFGSVTIPASVAITVGGDGPQRDGSPIAILSRGDIVSSATWNLVGKGWKGGDIGQPGYGPGRGSFGAGHVTFGGDNSYASDIYNHGTPDGDLHSLFSLSCPLGSGGGGGLVATGLPGVSGGGALQLSALGNLVVSGLVDVSGPPAPVDFVNDKWAGGGSAGTVLFDTAKAFADEKVTVVANGSDSRNFPGSGGRVAVYANFGDHKGNYTAHNGYLHSGSDTYEVSYARGTLYFARPGSFPFVTETGPRTITLQGVVTKEDTHPLSGNFDARFWLFDAPSGGNYLGGTDANVHLTNGFFSQEITLPASVFRDHDLVYVEVWIDTNKNGLDNGDRFSERFKITSVPYADNANRLDGVK